MKSKSMYRITAILSLALALTAGGCKKTASTPSTPSTPVASWDTVTYDSLVTIQAALNQASSAVKQYPQFKADYNAAVRAYNVAERSFKLYEASVKTPTDQAAIDSQMTALVAQVASLTTAIEGAKK